MAFKFERIFYKTFLLFGDGAFDTKSIYNRLQNAVLFFIRKNFLENFTSLHDIVNCIMRHRHKIQ